MIRSRWPLVVALSSLVLGVSLGMVSAYIDSLDSSTPSTASNQERWLASVSNTELPASLENADGERRTSNERGRNGQGPRRDRPAPTETVVALLPADSAASDRDLAETETDPTTIAALPPQTEAIVNSVGGEGLYDPPRGDVRLAVISDLNSAYGSVDYDSEVDKAIALLPFWQPDLVIAGGDMVAGQSPSLTPDRIRAMWTAFDEHVAAPLRELEIPFGFTIGNHDASGARSSGGSFIFQTERSLASDYWNAPEHDPGLTFVDRFEFPFYYSFEQNDIFYLVWDGSTSAIPSDKLAWVESVLASPAAREARARILISHLPLYGIAVGRDRPGEVMQNPEQLRAMLERYNVHTYISGHQHAYYPGHRGNLQLLHAGILGSGPRQLIAGNVTPSKTLTVVDIDFDTPELTRYTTYDVRSLAVIDDSSLPRYLTGHNGLVLRRDVEWDELAEGDRVVCTQRLNAALCQP